MVGISDRSAGDAGLPVCGRHSETHPSRELAQQHSLQGREQDSDMFAPKSAYDPLFIM